MELLGSHGASAIPCRASDLLKPDAMTERVPPLERPTITPGDAAPAGGRASSSSESPPAHLKASAFASVEREYVRTVLEYYLWLPGTAAVVSRHDRRCARMLFRRGVPLSLVTAAMAVATARRTFRTGDPLPRVRALHYFLPVVDELLETSFDPAYVAYLEQKLRPLVAMKGGTEPHLRVDNAETSAQPGEGSPNPLREASSSRWRLAPSSGLHGSERYLEAGPQTGLAFTRLDRRPA